LFHCPYVKSMSFGTAVYYQIVILKLIKSENNN
jgi:hypothetical protein